MGSDEATVIVEPSGIVFGARPDETIFAAAARHGYRWPTVCGGLGTCHTCTLTVVEGAEHLSAVSAYEAEGLDEINATWHGDPHERRMACQVRVHGDVRVRKPGVRPAAPAP